MIKVAKIDTVPGGTSPVPKLYIVHPPGLGDYSHRFKKNPTLLCFLVWKHRKTTQGARFFLLPSTHQSKNSVFQVFQDLWQAL